MSPERKTEKTGRERIAWNTLVSWCSQLVLVITGFVLPRLMSDNLGQIQLGIWDLCWSFVSYINLMGIGIGGSISMYVARYRSQQRSSDLTQLLNTTVLLQIIQACLFLIATFLVIYFLPRFYGTTLGSSLQETQYVMALLGTVAAIQVFFDTARGILTGFHRWDIHNVIHAGTNILSTGLMISALLFDGSIIEVAMAYSFAMTLGTLFRALVVHRICDVGPINPLQPSSSKAKKVIQYGLKHIIADMPPLILTQSISILLVSALGPAALAILSRPLGLVRHVRGFANKFGFMLVPAMGEIEDKKEQQSFYLFATRFSFAFTIPVLGILALFGEPIMRFWMGDNYAVHSLVLLISLGYIFPIAQDISMRILMGLNRHGKISLFNLVIVLLILSLEALVMSEFEWNIEVAALLIVIPMNIVYGILLPIFACRELDIAVIDYIKISVLPPIAAVMPSALVLVALDFLNIENLLIQITSISVALFLICVTYFFLIPEASRQRLRQLVFTPHRKSKLKNSLLNFLYHSGFYRIYFWLHREQILFLMVHGVADQNQRGKWLPLRTQIYRDQFDKTVDLLSRYFTYISFSDAIAILEGKKPPVQNGLVITFDDGYRNTIPAIREFYGRFKVAPISFVTTENLTSGSPFWFDRIDYALQQLESDFNWRTEGIDFKFRVDTRDHLKSDFHTFRNSVMSSFRNDTKFSQMLAELAMTLEATSGRQLSSIIESDKYAEVLQWTDLPALVNSETLQIGNHTSHHLRLDRLSASELESQVIDAKEKVENMLNRECHFFCYPNGSYDESAIKKIGELGQVAAVTTDIGFNKKGCNLLAIKRFNFPVRGTEAETLHALVTFHSLPFSR